MDSELKSGIQSLVSRIESATGTGTPDPELRCESASGPSTLIKLTNALYFDHNIYIKPMSRKATAQDCWISINITCFRI